MLPDEITSALDPELVEEVLNVITDLRNETDMTMLLVTHEMSFVSEFADRVLLLEHGHIVEEGPPDEIFHSPQHQRTKSEPPQDEWTPVVGSLSPEVSNGTSTSVIHRRVQAPGR